MKITIKAARVNAGLTQAEAAKKLCASREALQSWETGKVHMRWENMERMSEVYGAPLQDLVPPPYKGRKNENKRK